MKSKRISNFFFLFLMLWANSAHTLSISMQTMQGWLTTIKQYFNKPTQNALMITTAVAGAAILTTFACAWKLWNKSDALHKKQKEYTELAERSALLRTNNADLRTSNDRLAAQVTNLSSQLSNQQTIALNLQRARQLPSAPPQYGEPIF